MQLLYTRDCLASTYRPVEPTRIEAAEIGFNLVARYEFKDRAQEKRREMQEKR